MPNPQSLLSTIPLPLWVFAALLFLLFAVGLWAALPDMMQRTSTKLPFEAPFANMVTALVTIVGSGLFFVAIGAAFTVLWHTMYDAVNGTAPNLSLGTGTLIAALLGAPFLIWGTILKHQTVRYQKEGHMTDRIAKAVEMLGADKTDLRHEADESGNLLRDKDGRLFAVERTLPNLEVRIGAILALERIAQDSTTHDKGRDHVRVMEILCAYIRNNAPASIADPVPYPQKCIETALEEKIKTSPHSWLFKLKRPREDIQLALKVIGRRNAEQIELERAHADGSSNGYRLDLSKVCLRRADMERMNFEKAVFFESNLEGAYLSSTNLQGSNLINTQLTGAQAKKAVLDNARLSGADLSYAILKEASLRNCSISHTHFVRTQLSGAAIKIPKNDQGHSVNRAFFINAIMSRTLIEGDLVGVVFHFDKRENEIYPFNVQYMKFRNARLGMTRNFFGEEITEIALPLSYLEATFGDASVASPKGYEPPKHWPNWCLPDTGALKFEAQYLLWSENPNDNVPPPNP